MTELLFNYNGEENGDEDDVFQCGKCKKVFSVISQFIAHKQEHIGDSAEPRQAADIKQQNTDTVWYEIETEVSTSQQGAQDDSEPGELVECHLRQDISSGQMAHDSTQEDMSTEQSGSNTGKLQGKRWTYELTKRLIFLYQNHESDFLSAIKPNRKIWQEIADKIEKVDGVSFALDQVENKWKNLKKTYKSILDNGNGSSSWQFFELMDQVCRKRRTRALSLASSLGGFKGGARICQISPSSPRGTVERSIDESYVTPLMKKRKLNQEPEWFRQFMIEKKRQHEEKMNIQREILAILKDMNKN